MPSHAGGSPDEAAISQPLPPRRGDHEGPEHGSEISLGLSPEKARQALGSIAHGSGLDAGPAPTDLRRRAITENVGAEVDIGPPADPDEAALDDLSAPPPALSTALAPPPKRKPRLRYVAAVCVVAAIGGASLSLVPDIGPFGWNAISDRLNASAHATALADLRARVQKDLAEDTSAAAGRALAAARTAHEAAPRYRPTSGYGAYVAFSRGLRFGKHAEDDSVGKQLLELVGPETSGDDVLSLAMAAQDAASGQLARARKDASALATRLPNDVDAAVLLGEIELAAKAPDKALVAFEKAVATERSARTLFGLARAALAQGDAAAAEKHAKDALAASPAHAGTRTLLASIAWRETAREGEALKLLSEVTEEKGQVRAAASEGELVDALTLLGRIHLARSRMSAAEQAFAAALKLDPQAVQALVGKGEHFYRAGRFTDALAQFEAAMRADADNVVAKVGVAKTWLALERMKEAKDFLKKLREAHPTEPLVAYWLARAEDALGNKKECEAAYLDAIQNGGSKPEVIDAYVSLAHLLSGLGRVDEATAKLSEASAKFPTSAELHRARGDVALQTGRYDEAKSELEAALAIHEDLGTRFKLAVTLRRMRSFDEASKTFDGVAAVDKEYPGLSLERGLLFEQTGQSDRALEMYNEALRKAPSDVDLMLRVGSTQVMAGQSSQAEAILREVIKQRPKSAEANHFLGRALLVKGTNLSEAMRFLEQATTIDPNRAEYFLYVGWGANEAGQPQKAQSALERALELDRELGDAYWQRGVLLQKQGATIDALNDLQAALQRRPSRYEAYATMALCLQDEGRWAEAEEAWRKAIAADGTMPEWHYRLGKIYASHGSDGAAGRELERAVKIVETSTKPKPGWLFDAHFLLAEALRSSGQRDKAIEHYKRFLDLAPRDNAYRPDAEKQLEAYGVRRRP
jgi:tetratricopeptide (TPR) repeat protein